MYAQETATFYAIVIGSLAVTISVSVYMFLTLRQHRITLLSYKDRILTEINFAEAERSRVAADLHDDLSSSLAAIKIHLQCINPSAAIERDQIDKAGSYIDNVMEKIREISNNLTPKALRNGNFIYAARELCNFINATTRLQVTFDGTEQPAWIPKANEIHLYRVTQEIINNAIRHSGATRIAVSVNSSAKMFMISIADNGVGFDRERINGNNSNGLKNISRRIDLMNGKIYLDTKPGEGTIYTIEIPCDEK